MDKYRRILVVIDPTKEEQPALTRAVRIARQEEHVKLKLLLSIYDLSYEMTSMLSSREREAMRSGVIAQRTEWMEAYAKPYVDEGIDIELKVVWHNRPFESIVHEVLEYGHDLVVKGTHQHPKLRSVIFTPTDWHLLRKCPTPVLLVREEEWPEAGNILVALNMSGEDPKHDELNERLIQEAKDLARLINGTLHLVNAYPATPVNIAIEIPEFDPQSYNEAMRQHHQQMMDKLVSRHHLEGQYTHIVQGLPEDVIPLVAEEISAELVILGTVGRSGITAALIGNTAEHVIDQLDCDLLAIKPADFVSPLAEKS